MPGYFETLGLTLLKGRVFRESDGPLAPPAVLIDEKMARAFWPDESPLGKRIATGMSANPRWSSIVGVVRHIRHRLHEEGRPQVYFPYAQRTFHSIYLAIRANIPPSSLVGPIRQRVQALDSGLPVFEVGTGDQLRSRAAAEQRFHALLLGIFAGTALLLAALGVYGVVFAAIDQRKHEIGVRRALGAGRSNILRLVLSRGLVLGLIGAAVGAAIAAGLTRFLRSLLFEVSATDPSTYVVASQLSLFVAALACAVPARLAAKVDPATALRAE